MCPVKNLKTRNLPGGNLLLFVPGFTKAVAETKYGNLKDKPFDVKLEVGSSQQFVEAHRHVLGQEFSYFKAMFSGDFQESTQQVIQLPAVNSLEAVRKLVGLAYRGKITVCPQDVQDVFLVCDFWGVDEVKAACVTFMLQNVDCHNCLDLLWLGQTYLCEALVAVSRALIARTFQFVARLQSFLDIPTQLLACVMDTDTMNLGQVGEDEVLAAVTRWVCHDHEDRRKDLAQILPLVRLALCSQPAVEKFEEETGVKVTDYCGGQASVTCARQYLERVAVFCGFSHTRTGPASPRIKTVEIFNLANCTSETFDLPEGPSYGMAFTFLGRIIYLAVFVRSGPMTTSQVVDFKVYTILPEQPRVKYKEAPDIFSDRAREVIQECLVAGGCVTYCPFRRVLYAVCLQHAHRVAVTLRDGEIWCDYDKDLPSLQTLVEGDKLVGMRSVCHQGEVFVAGGNCGATLQPEIRPDVFVLPYDANDWGRRPSMALKRTDFALASYKRKLVVSGGYGGKTKLRRLQSCESFDTETSAWSPMPDLQQSRSHHAMVVANGQLYTLAGKTYSSQKLSGQHQWLPGGARIVSRLVEMLVDKDNDEEHDDDGYKNGWVRLVLLEMARCNFSAIAI